MRTLAKAPAISASSIVITDGTGERSEGDIVRTETIL